MSIVDGAECGWLFSTVLVVISLFDGPDLVCDCICLDGIRSFPGLDGRLVLLDAEVYLCFSFGLRDIDLLWFHPILFVVILLPLRIQMLLQTSSELGLESISIEIASCEPVV